MPNIFARIAGLINPSRKPAQRNATEDRFARIVKSDRDRLSKPRIVSEPTSNLNRERINRRLDEIKNLKPKDRQALEKQRREDADQARNERDPEYRFLYMEEYVSSPESSNVTGFWYDSEREEFYVDFHDGAMYKYLSVPIIIANEFYRAPSRGESVWDYFRVRGTKLGHQHPYVMMTSPVASKGAGKPIHAPMFGTRKWEESSGTARKHGKEVVKQSSGPSGFAGKREESKAKYFKSFKDLQNESLKRRKK